MQGYGTTKNFVHLSVKMVNPEFCNFCYIALKSLSLEQSQNAIGLKVPSLKSSLLLVFPQIFWPSTLSRLMAECWYTAGGFVWCERPFYLVKQPKEKWECDFHDDAPPLSFQLQVTEVIF